jgi:hypothetical protein
VALENQWKSAAKRLDPIDEQLKFGRMKMASANQSSTFSFGFSFPREAFIISPGASERTHGSVENVRGKEEIAQL